eukprot:CFRG6686T1
MLTKNTAGNVLQYLTKNGLPGKNQSTVQERQSDQLQSITDTSDNSSYFFIRIRVLQLYISLAHVLCGTDKELENDYISLSISAESCKILSRKADCIKMNGNAQKLNAMYEAWWRTAFHTSNTDILHDLIKDIRKTYCRSAGVNTKTGFKRKSRKSSCDRVTDKFEVSIYYFNFRSSFTCHRLILLATSSNVKKQQHSFDGSYLNRSNNELDGHEKGNEGHPPPPAEARGALITKQRGDRNMGVIIPTMPIKQKDYTGICECASKTDRTVCASTCLCETNSTPTSPIRNTEFPTFSMPQSEGGTPHYSKRNLTSHSANQRAGIITRATTKLFHKLAQNRQHNQDRHVNGDTRSTSTAETSTDSCEIALGESMRSHASQDHALDHAHGERLKQSKCSKLDCELDILLEPCSCVTGNIVRFAIGGCRCNSGTRRKRRSFFLPRVRGLRSKGK